MATTSLQTATQPNWAKTTIAFNPRTRKYEVTPASRGGEEMYVDPVTGKYVSPIDYLFTANTPEAIQYRANNSSLINLIKDTGLDYRSGQNLLDTVQSYNNVASNADQTEALRNYLGQQLKNQGINSFTQIEKRVVNGKDKYYNKTTGAEINSVLFDDKAGTKYILTDQGIQKQFDPITRLSVQLTPYVDPSSSGGAWGTQAGASGAPGFGPQGMLRQLAQRFINLTGLTDLNKLGVRTTTEYHEAGNMVYVPVLTTTYYDKDTGKAIGFNGELGGWGQGPGMTYANILFDDDGKPRIRTYGEDTNSVGDILPILSIALMAIPGIGQAVGAALLPTGVSTAVATAVGNAVVSAGLQVASGVPIEKAVLNSAASLGVSQLVPNLSGNVYIDNAVKSVATAALTGGDVGNALANSLIATGGNELLGNASFTGDKVVDSAIASAITSGVQAAATDGDVGASAFKGALAGASGQLTKEEKMAESARSGAGFIGEDVTEPTNVAGDIGKDTATIPPSGNTVVVIEVDKNSNQALVIDEVGNTSVVSATDSATGNSVNSGEVVTLTPDNSLTTGQETVATGIADDMASGGFVDTAPVVTAPVDTGVTDTGAVDTTQVATSDEAPSTNINQGITEPTNVAEPGIDPRILAQGVTGGQFGEGELLQAGAQIPVNRLQELMQIRPDLVTMSDTGTYLVTVPQSDGAYTNYEISASGQVLSATPGVSVGPGKDPSKAASALEDVIKIEEGRSSTQAVPEGSGSSGSVQQKATDLSPAAQETLLQIGGVLGLGEQDPDAVYEALIGGASGGIGDVALLGYDQLTKLQDEIELIFDEPNLPADARSEIARIYAEVTDQKRIQEEAIRDQLLNDQKPTEQQVADTGLTVVGQPVNETTVVSPTTLSVTPPTIAPVVTEPVVSQPVVAEPVTKEPVTPEIITNVPSTTPQITQPVDQALTVITPTPPPSVIEPTPPTSGVTGIVLQNNGDGTALVLTNDGNATNVPATDAVSKEPLTPGSSVTIDQNTNTATATPPASDGGAQAPIVSAPPTVQDTGGQQVLGGGQQPTTDAGSIIDTPIGPDTSTPTVPEPVVEEPVVQEPPSPPSPPPAVPTTPEEPITEPPQEPVVDKTEEDLLLEQIIRELEPTPPVSEGVPIQEPEFPEPPLVLPESPTINVADRLTIRPVVDRGYRRPSVSPGSRVEESAQILPLRPGLSEGGTGGIEGTTEQEQEPVWNVRSLKLRRLLGI